MVIIDVEGYSDPVKGSAAVSILNNLLRAGIKISHLCGGKAACGTCRVQILEGAHLCTPMGEREWMRLHGARKEELKDILGTRPELRLACQTYCRGTVRLKVLAPGKKQGL
jgi:adenylate cyclase